MKQLLTLFFIGIASLYAQTVPSYVPTNGLVGWWPFNGNANDESGNNRNGTVNGASLSTDRFGNANGSYSFDGVNDFIQMPSTSISGSFTFSGWYKMPSYNISGINDMVFFCNHSGSNDINRNVLVGYRNYQNEFGHSTYATGNSNNLTGYYALNQTPSPNVWHHLVCVFNNGAYVKMYLDDTLFYTNNTVVSNSNLQSLPMYFGIGIPQQFGFYNGFLDEIALWNRALSAQELSTLFSGCQDSLLVNPQNFTAYSSTGWANFKCESSDTAATYQWQQSNGAGWSNLSNLGNYSGATSDSLVITGVTASMNNYDYRCIVTGCTTDTSDVAVLTVVNGIGLGESTLQKLTISPNPTAGIVSLNTAVVGNYELLTLDGRVLESGTAKKDYDLTNYPKGVYHLRLSTDEGTRVIKVVKN